MLVVYRVRDGKTISVYKAERSAKARVTKNNRALIMRVLRNESNERAWYQDKLEEWAYCSWSEYAEHFYRYHKSSN